MKNNRISVKLESLSKLIEQYGSVGIAFSGGVDSSFLLAVASDVLKDRAQAVIVKSSVFSDYEESMAADFLSRTGITGHVIEADIISVRDFVKNGENRCYHCKQFLFKNMIKKINELGLSVLAHGMNADDLLDYRPGSRAAEELGVKSPLCEAGFTREEIRKVSEMMGLNTAHIQKMACLATRIPYGTEISRERLEMVEKSEDILRKAGLKNFRVRYHDKVARIEVSEDDFFLFSENNFRKFVSDSLKKTGFVYVSLDLDGFYSGSMNRTLDL